MPTISCSFPSTENPLTNGGAGAGTFTNTVSATWTIAVQAVASAKCHGSGATGLNDAIAKCTGSWLGNSQVVTGTIFSSGSPGASENEIHTCMRMLTGPDRVFTIEHDYTATVLNLADWGVTDGHQGDFSVIGGATVTELITGDIIKGDTSGTTARAFINNVQQATGTSINTGQGEPAIGFDNGDSTNFYLSAFTATDGASSAGNIAWIKA